MTPLVKAQSKTSKPAAARRATAQKREASKPEAGKRAASAAKNGSKKKTTAKRAAKKASGALGGAQRPRAKVGRLVHADVGALLERIDLAIPDPHVELRFENPWQLLVAVILSAQSTDRTVNVVTPELFRRWPTPRDLAAAAQEDVEVVVKSTGFFRNKSKAIRGASQLLLDRFDGSVPRSLEELVEVPGVARKTANVVLGAAYGISSGIVTDTHAMRVSQRLGLTREEAPEKIEADLCRLFPREHWIALSHQLVLHGRHLCVARALACTRCALNELCPSRQAPAEGSWAERARAEASDMQERAIGFSRARANAPA